MVIFDTSQGSFKIGVSHRGMKIFTLMLFIKGLNTLPYLSLTLYYPQKIPTGCLHNGKVIGSSIHTSWKQSIGNANNMDGGQQILKAFYGDDPYHLLIFLNVISATTGSLEALPHWLETEHWLRPF